jgi:hypothetical protein
LNLFEIDSIVDGGDGNNITVVAKEEDMDLFMTIKTWDNK